jgi:hypothetical protein
VKHGHVATHAAVRGSQQRRTSHVHRQSRIRRAVLLRAAPERRASDLNVTLPRAPGNLDGHLARGGREIGEIGVEIDEVRERRQRRTRAITRPLAEKALSVTARGQLQRGRKYQVDMHAREGQRRLGRVSDHQPGERPE